MLTTEDQKYLKLSFNIQEQLAKSIKGSSRSMIDVCINLLKRYLKPREHDMLFDQSLLIFVIDYLWTNLMHSELNQDHFTSKGGVYLMLDIIAVV